MIKVTAFYPNEEGKKFDMGYYFNKHIPMIQQKLGLRVSVWLWNRDWVVQSLGHVQPSSLCFIYISIR